MEYSDIIMFHLHNICGLMNTFYAHQIGSHNLPLSLCMHERLSYELPFHSHAYRMSHRLAGYITWSMNMILWTNEA